MPPTPKSVLMAMADYADDAGLCWPSIPSICEWTCFSERAVHGAIRWLEAAGVVVADRSNGRHTRYAISPSAYQPPQDMRHRSSCAPAVDAVEPPQMPQSPPQMPQSPPQQLRSNHQEPPRTTKKATTNKMALALIEALPDWLPADAWADWVEYRRKGKNPMTDKAVELSIRELSKLRDQGYEPRAVIENAILVGWRGLYPPRNGSPKAATVVPIRPSASADFRGKTYAGTAIEDLPPDLRDAARAAIADG